MCLSACFIILVSCLWAAFVAFGCNRHSSSHIDVKDHPKDKDTDAFLVKCINVALNEVDNDIVDSVRNGVMSVQVFVDFGLVFLLAKVGDIIGFMFDAAERMGCFQQLAMFLKNEAVVVDTLVFGLGFPFLQEWLHVVLSRVVLVGCVC